MMKWMNLKQFVDLFFENNRSCQRVVEILFLKIFFEYKFAYYVYR